MVVQGNWRLSELHLRLLIKGFVQLRLGIRDYRIVATEDYGNHWKVKIKYREDETPSWPLKHLFAINYDGSLIWDKSC